MATLPCPLCGWKLRSPENPQPAERVGSPHHGLHSSGDEIFAGKLSSGRTMSSPPRPPWQRRRLGHSADERRIVCG